jgi:hypothetical protein
MVGREGFGLRLEPRGGSGAEAVEILRFAQDDNSCPLFGTRTWYQERGNPESSGAVHQKFIREALMRNGK